MTDLPPQSPRPPDYASAHARHADRRPGAVTWYVVYLIAMVLLYLVVAAAGGFGFFYADQIPDMPASERQELTIMAAIYGVIGIVFAVVFLVPLFIGRRPWAWVMGIVFIALGLTSCCLWPALIPLLIFYIKPEVKAYYAAA